ncbi:hypothetical protein [Bacillus atrophaeus]|nr:hypothetical protein [Bacillus atrophaeus]
MEKAEKIEKQFQKGAKTAEEVGKFGGKLLLKTSLICLKRKF